MSKFCAVADLHGHLGFTIQECDYLLVAGDILPRSVQKDTEKSEVWIKEQLIPWAEKQPCRKVIFVAGNHDFYFEKSVEVFQGHEKIIFQEKDDYIVNLRDGTRILITPWCKPFGRWAFMKDIEEQKKLYEKYKDGKKVDIILSHDAPYGTNDIIQDTNVFWYTPEHIGNKALRDLILDLQPVWNIHGHLHSTKHEPEMLGDTKVVCCSILGEDYTPQYEPFYFEYEKEIGI